MPTVCVACKIPNGLTLRVFEKRETQEPVPGGGYRTVSQFHHTGKAVQVNGPAHAQNEGPRHPEVGGFALTPGVDKEIWDAWLAANKDSDMVRNGLVFAHEKDQNATAEARDKRDLRSGLERLDPNKAPRGIKITQATAV